MAEEGEAASSSTATTEEDGWVDVRVADADTPTTSAAVGTVSDSTSADTEVIANDTTAVATGDHTSSSQVTSDQISGVGIGVGPPSSVSDVSATDALPSSGDSTMVDGGGGGSDGAAAAAAAGIGIGSSSEDAEMSEADRAAIQALLLADDSAFAASLAAEGGGGSAGGTEMDSVMTAADGDSGFGGDTVSRIIDDRTFALGAMQQTYLDRGREELYDIFPHFVVPDTLATMLPPSVSLGSFPDSVKTTTIKDTKELSDPESPIILMDSETLIRLKRLIWGDMAQPKDIDRWFSQGFGWVPLDDMRFGLLQLHGGPCGLLAPVQGFVIRRLLFADSTDTAAAEPKVSADKDVGSMSAMSLTGDVAAEVVLKKRTDVHIEDGSDVPIQPTNRQRTDALIWALIRVLLNSATDKTRLFFVVSVDEQSKNWFWYRQCSNVEELSRVIRQSLPLLHSRVGVVAFLFSVIMSRTPEFILGEVDDMSQPLVLPEFGHCSQELVNLMISGRAVTNIHDGDKTLTGDTVTSTDGLDPDVFVLKGIGPNQEIGFLTSLEVLKYVRVGEHYKTPLAPIWVVGSASHYSVMFALVPAVGKVSTLEKEMNDLRRMFDVYDPLGHGFVEWSKIDTLLKDIKKSSVIKDKRMSVAHTWELRPILDPEMTGVVVWNNFYNGYLAKKRELTMKWVCDKCTLMNPLSKQICDLCGARRLTTSRIVEDPEEVAKQEALKKAEVKVPREFVLYHFNGLRQTRKDRPTLTKLNVLDEAEMVTATLCYSEEMTGLVRTKWPYALVEWTGPFQPKIQ